VALLTVIVLLLSVSAPWEMTSAGCVVSPLNVAGVNVSAIGCDPRMTVVPPLMAAAVEPIVVPVPLALKMGLGLKVNVALADTSKVAPAAIEICGVALIEALVPSTSVPPLMLVMPA
jgi:hypothetical protein